MRVAHRQTDDTLHGLTERLPLDLLLTKTFLPVVQGDETIRLYNGVVNPLQTLPAGGAEGDPFAEGASLAWQ